MTKLIRLGAAALALLLAPSARADEPFQPPRLLSEWRLFEGDGSSQKPVPGVLPYDVNMPLFSDYAAKHRFVRVPAGRGAVYRADGPFSFPEGTVLVKTFAYPRDRRDPGRGERLIETRLLVHRPEGWIGLPYVWNAAQTEAVLRPGGAAVDGVSWVHDDGRARVTRYLVPNMNQCKACHEAGGRGHMAPLGTTAANLNRPFKYPEGLIGQLERWTAAGALAGAPPAREAPALPAWDDPGGAPLERRARAYLAVNCAHCHNPTGPADTAGLDLRFEQAEPVKFGVGKAPVAAGRGTGGRRVDVAPGSPDDSILLYRMESVETGVMMPELGRRLVHEEGAALIRRWIASLPPDAGKAP